RAIGGAQSPDSGGFSIENEFVTYRIAADGLNERFVDRGTGVNHVVSNAPCAWIKRAGKTILPTHAALRDGLLTLQFEGAAGEAKVEAVIQLNAKKTYFVWKVVSLSSSNVDEFVFADVPLTLRGSAGENFVATAM